MSKTPNPASVRIRRASLTDLPQVEALDQACFSQPWPAGSFLYELRPDSASIFLVAEQTSPDGDTHIIAVLLIWIIQDEAEIGALAVASGFRKQGIARWLLVEGLKLAYAAGARKSLLEVRVSNQSALHLYYGFGYALLGVRPAYYPDNHEDALLLCLDPLDPKLLPNLGKA